MYVDEPHPTAAALAPPFAAAVFFATIALGIGALAVIALPPILWAFTAPVIALASGCAGFAGWYALALRRVRYTIADGRLVAARGGSRVVAPLGGVTRIVTPGDGATGEDVSGAGSARNFANRSHDNVLIEVGGEWLRVSPSDPATFIAALRAASGEEPPAV